MQKSNIIHSVFCLEFFNQRNDTLTVLYQVTTLPGISIMASRYIEYFGDPDIFYLRDALARASINIVPQSLLVKPLLDGRTAATVEKFITNNETYVLKRTSKDNWLPAAAECPGEGPLWVSGSLNQERLPR